MTSLRLFLALCCMGCVALPVIAEEDSLEPKAVIEKPLSSNSQGRFSGALIQGKSMRLEGIPQSATVPAQEKIEKRQHGFIDATSLLIIGGFCLLLAIVAFVSVLVVRKKNNS